MTARMLLSLFLDFFRCRKSWWPRPTLKRAETNSNLHLDLEEERIQQLPPKIKMEVKMEKEEEEATCNVQRVVDSGESDYDSVRNLELPVTTEPDGDDDEDDNDNGNDDNADSHNDNDNFQDAEVKVEVESDADVDEFGFDDPRLPEIII